MKTTVHIVSTIHLNSELIHEMALADIRVVQEDFIRKTIKIPENLDGNCIRSVIVLTSKIGVRAWIGIASRLRLYLNQYTVYCLASGTKILATQHGLHIAGVGHDAASLVDVILKDKSIDRVSFICSKARRDELPDKLKSYGIDVQEIPAYKTDLTPIEIQEDYQGVLFFSPSAVDSFRLLNKSTTCVAFCLGRTTANHAQQVGFSKIQTADNSTPESLVKMVIHFYKTQIIRAEK